MAKVKVSPFWCDGELRDWMLAYAKERGVSQGRVLEAALRELQASAMGGVPDLGPESKPAAVKPLVQSAGGSVHALASAKRGPVRVDTVEDAKSWSSVQWERQQRLNKAKGL